MAKCAANKTKAVTQSVFANLIFVPFFNRESGASSFTQREKASTDSFQMDLIFLSVFTGWLLMLPAVCFLFYF